MNTAYEDGFGYAFTYCLVRGNSLSELDDLIRREEKVEPPVGILETRLSGLRDARTYVKLCLQARGHLDQEPIETISHGYTKRRAKD